MTQKAIIVTVFPLRDGEDLEQIASTDGDAVVAAVGKRDGAGYQVAIVVDSDLDAKTMATRAARAAR